MNHFNDAAGAHSNNIAMTGPARLESPLDTELTRAAETASSALACARDLRSQLTPVLRESTPQTEAEGKRGPAECIFADRIQDINALSLETLQVIADIKERLQL